MPITPDAPYPKSPGDSIRSQDWNQAVDEVIRLDNDKVDRTGDTVTGDLSVNGNVTTGGDLSVDQEVTGDSLSVTSFMTVGETTHQEGKIRLFRESNEDDAFVGHGIGTEAFFNRYGGASSFANSIGHRFYRGGGELIAQIGTGGAGTPSTRLNSQFEGNVTILGDLAVPKTGAGNALLTNTTFNNETFLTANNLKLSMAAFSFVGTTNYEFMIGHTAFTILPGPILATTFIRGLGVNHNGDVFIRGNLTVGGSKGGFVVDHFINRAGDALEQGDVVVISTSQRLQQSSGVANNIPMPEVDLTETAFDTRVCGIVAEVVTENELPLVEEEPQEVDAEVEKKIRNLLKQGKITEEDLLAGRGLEDVLGEVKPAKKAKKAHPLQRFAAKADADLVATRIQDKQMGKMVTLGCYAHCKVDADIAPIEAGDLLTTSPTKGHAQKVDDPSKAVGAIIGKALAPLKKGKGKIPVFVMMQ